MRTLATAARSAAQHVADGLVTAGIIRRATVGLYHGLPPANECCDDRFPDVVASWKRLGAPPDTGKPPTIGTTSACGQLPVAEINVRMRRCWPTPEAVTPPLDLFQAAATELADAAEVGWLALMSWACEAEFKRNDGSLRGLWVGPVDAVAAQGGCAGVMWTVYAQLRT